MQINDRLSESRTNATYLHLNSSHMLDSPIARSSRHLSPTLKTGISAGSPSYFRLNKVPVIDLLTWNQEIGHRFSSVTPGKSRFLNELKINTTEEKPSFRYEDYNSSSKDYASMKLSEVVDRSADVRPMLRVRSPFFRKFKKQLREGGFGCVRGMCTVAANSPKITRTSVPRLRHLQAVSQLRSLKAENTFRSVLGDRSPKCVSKKLFFNAEKYSRTPPRSNLLSSKFERVEELPTVHAEVTVAEQVREFETRLAAELKLVGPTKVRRDAYLS